MTAYASQVWARDATSTAWTLDEDGNLDLAPIYGPPEANALFGSAGYPQSWFRDDRTIRDGATATLDVLDTLPTISGFTMSFGSDFQPGGDLYILTADTGTPGAGNRNVHYWNGSWNLLTTTPLGVSYNRLDAQRSGYLLMCSAGNSSSGGGPAWYNIGTNTPSSAWEPSTSTGGPGVAGFSRSVLWNTTDGLVLFEPSTAASAPTLAGIWAIDTAGGTSSGPHQLGYTWSGTGGFPRPDTMVRDQLDGYWLIVQTGTNSYEAVRFDKAGLTATDGPYDVDPGSPYTSTVEVVGAPVMGPEPEPPVIGGIVLGNRIGSGRGLVLG